jgi:chromosome segregation ATPase
MPNGSQFSVDVNATLNTDNIPKQLQTLNAKLTKTTSSMVKIPVGFDLETGKKVFGDFIKDVRKYTDEIGNSFKRITITDPFSGLVKSDNITQVTDSIKTLTTETHKWTNSKGEIQNWTTSIDGAGQTIQTRTKQYINDTNELVTETSKWGRNAQGQWAQLSDTIKTTTDIIKESTTSTSSVVGQIDDLGKSYQGLITTTEKVGSNGEYLRTVVSQYTNEMGQAVVKTEQFNKVGQQVATTMRKIGDAKKGSVETGKTTLIDASGNKTITQYADGVATLRTEVNQYKTALGGLVTVTSTYNAQTNELISKNREVTTNLQEQTKELEKEKQLKQQLTTTTREHEQIIQREGESYKAVVKTIQEETHDMGTLTTTITTYKNKLGETVVETQKLDSNGKAVAQTTRTITKELNNAGNNANKASNGVKNLGDSAERANYGVKNLGWSLSDAFSRLANFYLASLPLRALQNGISNAVETVKEFDSALIEFRKVSDLAGESLTNYVAKLAEMGEVTGSTMQAMVEASTEFRKSGFTDEDSAKLAVIAEKYRNIADEEISAGESASFIIAQMKAFNIEADQAEHIIDAVYL